MNTRTIYMVTTSGIDKSRYPWTPNSVTRIANPKKHEPTKKTKETMLKWVELIEDWKKKWLFILWPRRKIINIFTTTDRNGKDESWMWTTPSGCCWTSDVDKYKMLYFFCKNTWLPECDHYFDF